MLKKIIWLILILLSMALAYLFMVAPKQFEAGANVVTGEGLSEIRDDTKALHAGLLIADLHGDTMLWKRSVLDASDTGHIDLPRLQKGNVALQIFSSVTKSPKGQNYDSNGADTDQITMLTFAQLQPPRTWTSLLERSLWHSEKLHSAEVDSAGALKIVKSSEDVEAFVAARGAGDKTVAGMLSIEGLQNLEGEQENLQKLYDAGFRMAGITHFFDNELGGSMHGLEKGGLTDLGREVVREMEDKGMIVDVAHSSHAAVAEILAMARRPVVSSHGGVQATCKVNRNLTDEEVRGVAKTGGVIGIGYWEGAICSTKPEDVAKAIAHVRDLVGIEYVGLGSDFDGAVTSAFDTAGVAQVTQALIDMKFTEEEIALVMGGNIMRVLQNGLRPIKSLPPPTSEAEAAE